MRNSFALATVTPIKHATGVKHATQASTNSSRRWPTPTVSGQLQETLFSVPPRLVEVAAGLCYIMYPKPPFKGIDAWKLGHTTRTVWIRAAEIDCFPVAWWPGGKYDERAMHRLFGHLRMSPSAEFFRRGADIDQWVLQQALKAGRAAELAALAEIFRRSAWNEEAA